MFTNRYMVAGCASLALSRRGRSIFGRFANQWEGGASKRHKDLLLIDLGADQIRALIFLVEAFCFPVKAAARAGDADEAAVKSREE